MVARFTVLVLFSSQERDNEDEKRIPINQYKYWKMVSGYTSFVTMKRRKISIIQCFRPPPCLICWGHQTLYEGRVRWVRCVTHDVYLRLPISGSPVASIASVHTAPILHCQAAGSRPPRPGLCLAWPVSLSVVTNTTSSLAVLCHNNIIPIL